MVLARANRCERSESPTRRAWQTYWLYGLTLASDFSFANRLLASGGEASLHFTCASESPLSDFWEQSQPVYTSPFQVENGKSNYYLYRHPRCDVLRFTGIADFYVWPERIICHQVGALDEHAVEILFLGVVLSYWLERQGIVSLHASAVVADGRAVVFLAANKGGKSSVAATLMQAGCPLLTDDILPIEKRQSAFKGRPGYPQMRMWPDQAEHFLGHHEDLERVDPALAKRRVPVGESDGLGTFCATSKPLACFYLPVRRPSKGTSTEIEIKSVPPRSAVLELVRHSFVPRTLQAVGLQPQRLAHLSELARHVPMRKIVYPSGVEHLPHLRRAILSDLNCNVDQ